MSAPEFPRLSRHQQADICLLLEGTYPYIRGGVSTWVHQLIQGLPQYRFALVFIGATRENYPDMHYQFPANVCHFEAHYLAEPLNLAKPSPQAGNPAWFEALDHLHTQLKHGGQQHGLAAYAPFIEQLQASLKGGAEAFFYSEQAWERITREYQANAPDLPFNEYFWTVRSMHTPLFKLLEIAQTAPSATVYHTISTGYAGVLGFFLSVLRQRKLLLTEHGIYTKERYIDLYQADWIRDPTPQFSMGLHAPTSYIRRMWGRFFEGLGRLTYAASSEIVTLFAANRQTQIQYGANPNRCRIIPNGVDIRQLATTRQQRAATIPQVIGLIGRVVPIKDIKTYLRATALAQRQLPNLQAWIIGGEDEDPAYAAECHQLTASLGLQTTVKFCGFQSVAAMLPHLGVVVLSSISEGQPLSVLEAYAAGVPVVVTDVGACREMVEGVTDADRALGKSGEVVPIASPDAMATALVHLLSNPNAWRAAQAAAIARVEAFYTQSAFLNHYDNLYQRTLEHGGHRL